MKANEPFKHRYTLVFEMDTIGDEVAPMPEDVEADAMRGLHDYYGAEVRCVRGPEPITEGFCGGAAVATAEDCAVKHCDAPSTLGMTVVIAGLRVEFCLCETHFDQLDRNLSVHKDGEDVWRMLAFVVGAVGGKVTIYPRDLREGPQLLTREDGLDGEVRLLAHGPDAEFRAKTGMITEEEADSIAAAQQRRHVERVVCDNCGKSVLVDEADDWIYAATDSSSYDMCSQSCVVALIEARGHEEKKQ